ncbi:hypothetical protein MKW92_021413 [Papaver armeniacum]|nr:hypothetical protein MKW92_021413 [Papaver armeniacum]
MVFVALDSEVQKLVCSTVAELIGASKILQQAVDFQITLDSFNMKQKIPSRFTVTRINSPGKGVFGTVKVEGNSNTADGPHAKKPRLEETTEIEDDKEVVE